MGVKVGQFGSKNGHTYEVRLSGNSVESGEILLGVPPVTISMAAGEHKFCGFKSTTAIVNILTDAPLLDLYSESVTGIRLTIEDVTVGTIEFDGYVTPFAFDQPFTGRLDLVTVNAVDLISVRKDAKYENIGPEHGTDMSALTIVQEICKRAGVNTIYLHLNFNDTNDMMKDASPLDVMVAQAGFLQDEVSDADALSAICKFFGYTGHVIGRSLYLYDEYLLADLSDVNIYSLYESGWTKVSHICKDPNSVYRPQSLSSIHNDISVTVERSYEGIQIKPAGSDTSILLPDVCSEENFETNTGTLGSAKRVYEEDGYISYRKPVKSKLLQLGKNEPTDYVPEGLITDNWVGDPILHDDWDNGAIAIRVEYIPKKELTVLGVTSTVRLASENKYLLWLRGVSTYGQMMADRFVLVGRQYADKCYSHTRGFAKIAIEFFEVKKGDWADIKDTVAADGVFRVGFVSLRNAGKIFTDDFYESSSNPWKSNDYNLASSFAADGYALLPTGLGSRIRSAHAIVEVPTSRPVLVDLGWINNYGAAVFSGYNGNVYITSLSLEGYGDPINEEHRDMRHVYGSSAVELLEVSTLLTSRESGSDQGNPNARPGVVSDERWAAGYGVGAASTIPISGILMTQLKARYDKPHAAYKMTVDGNIKPYAGVIFNDKTYTVEAYDRDIYNDTTTITID